MEFLIFLLGKQPMKNTLKHFPIIVVVGALLCTAGCFSKPLPDCAFACGTDSECPINYRCVRDICLRNDIPDHEVCTWTTSADAAAAPTPDASTPEAYASTPDVDASADVDAAL